MKRVLIISPSFPPVNAADMHRVRLSLPYFRRFGWEPTVLAVKPERNEAAQDALLNETIPDETEIIWVDALNPKWTRKLGLGSLGLRSLPFMRREGDRLLRRGCFDLVYFSTTVFPVMILGASWKRRFGVPYVLDMQDPWHDAYHLSKPQWERPKKFWFSYRLNKFLEPRAMRRVDGLVSVSDTYTHTLQDRYENIRPEMCDTIPFGGSAGDFDVVRSNAVKNPIFDPADGFLHLVNTGCAGHSMRFSFEVFFKALRKGLEQSPELFGRLRLHFVGTSYAQLGAGERTVEPVAEGCGVAEYVTERTDRVPYFQALKVLLDADMLLIPGLDEPGYTASKLYPYILARKPILSVVHKDSSVVSILRRTRAGSCIGFDPSMDQNALADEVSVVWEKLLRKLSTEPDTDWAAFEPYTAREMTRRQINSFERAVLAHGN